LKQSKTKDYYKILGITRNADKSEVKKGYKKQAMVWHPDKNKGNEEEAEKKFQEIAEAYEVLSDDEVRLKEQKMAERRTAGRLERSHSKIPSTHLTNTTSSTPRSFAPGTTGERTSWTTTEGAAEVQGSTTLDMATSTLDRGTRTRTSTSTSNINIRGGGATFFWNRDLKPLFNYPLSISLWQLAQIHVCFIYII
jgi:curved DNA-binding protein CbpA